VVVITVVIMVMMTVVVVVIMVVVVEMITVVVVVIMVVITVVIMVVIMVVVVMGGCTYHGSSSNFPTQVAEHAIKAVLHQHASEILHNTNAVVRIKGEQQKATNGWRAYRGAKHRFVTR